MSERIGGNDKEFLGRKDGYINIKVEDVINTDGYIKQEILKRFLFVNAISKEREKLRDVLISACRLGYKSLGELMASVVDVKAKKVIDVEKLGKFLSAQGLSIADFQIDGKKGERLNVE